MERQTAMGERGGGGGDVDAERVVEKVNPDLECERNAGNGGVILWLEREKARKRRGGGGVGRVRDFEDLRRCKTLF